MISTKLAIFACLLSVMLSGCSDKTTPTPRAEPVLPGSLRPTPIVEPATLQFWLNDGSQKEDDPRILEVDGHPCGGVATLKVTTIPSPDDIIDTDIIIETDESGRELSSWRAPTDFFPDGIRGDLIGISNGNNTSFWVDSQGHLFQRDPDKQQSIDFVECPPLDRFKASVYTQCQRIRDQENGATRIIASEAACT